MDETREQQTKGTNEINSECMRNSYRKQAERKPFCKPKMETIPPDGGWGWIIVFGGFVSMILISLSLVGFGILFSPLLMTLGVSSASVAWIFSLHGVIWNASILLIGPLCQEFGWRKVAIAGGISNFLSLFLSMFASNASFLFFSYSLLGGFGGSTGAVVCQFVVSKYFEKHRGFALAVMTLGMCVGGFISPLFANFLLQEFKYKGTMLIYSGIVLNQCVTGALFQPVRWHLKRVETSRVADCGDNGPNEADLILAEYEVEEGMKVRRLSNVYRQSNDLSTYSVGALGQSSLDVSFIVQSNISNLSANDELEAELNKESLRLIFSKILKSVTENLKLFRSWRVIVISIGSGCLILGYVNFQMWIPFAVTSAGHSLQAAAWCVSSASIANVIARISMSFLSDKRMFSVRKGYTFGILFTGIFIMAFSLMENITFLLIFSCCWGFSVGTSMSLHSIVMIEVMGVELFPGVLGASSLTIAVFTITVGPAIGVIRDATSSYFYALLTIVALEFIAFGLWMTMPLAIKRDKKTERQTSALYDVEKS